MVKDKEKSSFSVERKSNSPKSLASNFQLLSNSTAAFHKTSLWVLLIRAVKVFSVYRCVEQSSIYVAYEHISGFGRAGKRTTFHFGSAGPFCHILHWGDASRVRLDLPTISSHQSEPETAFCLCRWAHLFILNPLSLRFLSGGQ